MKGGIGILLPGVDTGFKCGGARFILEQKHPDLGTNFFTIYIFPFCTRFSFPFSAIEELI